MLRTVNVCTIENLKKKVKSHADAFKNPISLGYLDSGECTLTAVE